MESPAAQENLFLFYSVIMGIYITFLYDLLRIGRRVITHNGFWVSVEDLAFWIYCAMKVFYLMHAESDGTLRWFAILGALLGMFLYKKTMLSFSLTDTCFHFQCRTQIQPRHQKFHSRQLPLLPESCFLPL